MALYIVKEECTSCGDCEPVCPTQSIVKKKGLYAINADTCTECDGDFDDPQCVDVCPIDNCILPLEA